MKLFSCECHRTQWMINQYWFRKGMVSWGKKPLREPMLTQLYVSRWWHHDVQSLCAINQPLLAHHWRVHECLLTSRFIAPSIPWGVSAPGGKMLKQLLKDHNFLDNSPIFIIESSTFNIFAFQKALHTIHFNLKSCFGFGERYLTPEFYGRMWVPAVSKHLQPLKWD